MNTEQLEIDGLLPSRKEQITRFIDCVKSEKSIVVNIATVLTNAIAVPAYLYYFVEDVIDPKLAKSRQWKRDVKRNKRFWD